MEEIGRFSGSFELEAASDHYVALFEKPAAPAFVRLAEGFTSIRREAAINMKPRMFSAPTFADICNGSENSVSLNWYPYWAPTR